MICLYNFLKNNTDIKLINLVNFSKIKNLIYEKNFNLSAIVIIIFL